tara:strand:+ start:11705 stop:12205 length:501 start_codon:yes stop_codon:yes gene_type:complete
MDSQFIIKSKKIKVIATDIDGVWTDSSMYYTSVGEHMKCFSTYDGMGVQILREVGIPTIILTSENSEIVLRRAEKLQINQVYINEKQKLNRMNQICNELEIGIDEVAYIGDDLNDLDLLRKVGLSGMPKNSPILDIFSPDYITQRSGGKGAFREFIDQIINAKNTN